MSRVGKAPVVIQEGVQVTVAEGLVSVKGRASTQTVQLRPEVTAKVEDGKVLFSRTDDSKTSRSLHGLYRALVQNAMKGVTQGFSKSLELVGVGYRANVRGKTLELNLGYSHPIQFAIPEGIEIKVEKQTLVHVKGASKALVGQVAAKIRSFREPEPFLGKGVKYKDEIIRRKAGKAASK